MGEDALRECGLEYALVHEASTPSSSEDTRSACRSFLENSIDLLIFCGGDGTARIVASAAGQVPILGIPAGVKMHSGVFAISPEAAKTKGITSPVAGAMKTLLPSTALIGRMFSRTRTRLERPG